MEGKGGDSWPHVELAIPWSPHNVQRVLALVHKGTNSSLINGNLGRFPGPATYIDSYGGKIITTKAVTLPLRIGLLPPHLYKVYVSPVLLKTCGGKCNQGSGTWLICQSLGCCLVG